MLEIMKKRNLKDIYRAAQVWEDIEPKHRPDHGGIYLEKRKNKLNIKGQDQHETKLANFSY
jgi:hypothetical protein